MYIHPQHGSESSQSPTHSPSSQVMADSNHDDSNIIDDAVKMELTKEDDLEDDGSTSPSTRPMRGGFQTSPNQPLFPPMMPGPPPLLGRGGLDFGIMN